MKFKAYLINELSTTEIDDFATINALIKKDCKPYLKLMGKDVFYKGMYLGSSQFVRRDVRQDRTPSGMDVEVFNNLNKWLKKEGHLTRNNVLIATSNKKQAEIFGQLYKIYPIGKVNYTWIWSKDLNMDDKKTGFDSYMLDILFSKEKSLLKIYTAKILDLPAIFDNITDQQVQIALKKAHAWFNKKGFVTNKNIELAHKKGFEIWFECKSYYAVKLG